jgi:polyisoprenoid-binding protein YceI
MPLHLVIDNQIKLIIMKSVILNFRSKFFRSAGVICLMAAFSLSAGINKAAAQTYKVAEGSIITVEGSSNIHDWTMTAKSFTCDANVVVKGDQVADISALSFSVPITNLKSKDSSMDKRAYTTLESDKYKAITFKLTEATVSGKTVKATGNLTISGVTVPVSIQSTYTIAGGVITFKGSEKIKYSQFKIKAPSFMLGALKVKDDLTIDILLKLKD